MTDKKANTGSKSLKDVLDTTAQETDNNPVSKFESDETFQNLPQNVKNSIRSGKILDNELSEIDDAIALKEQKGIETLNAVRVEKNLPPITKEDLNTSMVDYKENPNNFKIDTSNDIDLTDRTLEEEVEKQLAIISGENYDDPAEDDNEVSEEKRLAYFEKLMEDAIQIEFNPLENKKKSNTKSAPLSYTIKRNKEYEDILKGVMENNSINFKTNKKNSLKSALLRDFVNRHPHVTTPLINSGFHITLSGASIPEIIQMNKMKASSDFELTMKKIKWIADHIVDSSIGKRISATQLSKITFYKDLETLWFNFILGTLPDEFEYPLTCTNDKCQENMKVKIKTSDLLLNAADFEDVTKYILYEDTDISDVLNYSKVSKEMTITLCGGRLAVTIINPTIFDSIMLNSRLEKLKNILGSYTEFLGYLLFIKNVGILDDDNKYVQYDEIEEILPILVGLSSEDIDEMDSYINNFSLSNEVKYGLRSYTCPKCGKVHPETVFDLSSMLFIVCQMYQNSVTLAKIRKKKELEIK